MRIIPLGGLGEVGKNMTVYEADGEIVVVDAGLAFPRDEHLGVDLVLPDFGYLARARDAIRARRAHARRTRITSARCRTSCARWRVREVWATRLTLGLIKSKLDEHGLLRAAELREVDPDGAAVELGPFRLEFVRMAHSIPDAVAIVLETPGGRVVAHRRLQARPHAGRRAADRRRPARRARQPRRRPPARRLDERRAARASRASERVVGEAFRQIIPQRSGRILVSSFASNIHRMQQAIDVAVEVRPQGLRRRPLDAQEPRTSRATSATWTCPTASLDPAGRPRRATRRDEQLILCTGSQGEPLSALTRIAYNDHPAVARRARRHGDHLGEAGARERAARARRDQPAREGGRRGAAPGERARARLRPRQRRGAAHDARRCSGRAP